MVPAEGREPLHCLRRSLRVLPVPDRGATTPRGRMVGWMELTVLGLSHGFFFFVGWTFLTLVFGTRRQAGLLALLQFCLIFTLNCSMFELIIFEIAGVLDPALRLLNWKVALELTLANLILVLPFSQVFFLVSDYGVARRRAAAVALAGLGIYLYLFWKIGQGFPTVAPSSPSS
eukprot:RCo000747